MSAQEKPRADPSLERRVKRELKTLKAMMTLYCRGHHGTRRGLCDECQPLWDYAEQRVQRCPFRANKPTCARCAVHCYKTDMRERIRAVMRYAGPRMTLRHPILTLFHIFDGKQAPPPLKPGTKE